MKINYINKNKLNKLIKLFSKNNFKLNKDKQIIIIKKNLFKELIENFNEIFYNENKNGLYILTDNEYIFELSVNDILIIEKNIIKTIYTFK